VIIGQILEPSDHDLGIPRPADGKSTGKDAGKDGRSAAAHPPGGSLHTNKVHANQARHDAKPQITATGKTPERSADHQR
jgi:hypothetical protein